MGNSNSQPANADSKPRYCAYFNTEGGCKKGDSCEFVHKSFNNNNNNNNNNRPQQGNNSQQQQSTRTPVATVYTGYGSAESHHSCLLIGETGSGKTTMLNVLTNYLCGGTLDNPVIAVPTKHYAKSTIFNNFKSTEVNTNNQAQSQTQKCTTYSFTLNNKANNNGQNRVFHFIDTPGFNDSQGTSKDTEHLQSICTAAASAKNLCCIILVLNGTTARFTLTMRNLFVQLSQLLPDSVLNNIIITFTNTEAHKRNFPIEQLYPHFTHAKIFHFDNSAFTKSPAQRAGPERKALQHEWDTSMLRCQRLVEVAAQFAPVSAEDFRKMRDLMMQVKQRIHQCLTDIANYQKISTAIELAEKQKQVAQHTQNANANYTQTVNVTQVSWVNVNYHSTICQLCDEICHHQCGLDEIADKGNNAFRGCTAFSRQDHCQQCRAHRNKQCGYKTHYHARKIKQQTTRTIQQVLQSVKDKYDNATNATQKAQHDLTTYAGQKKLIEDSMNNVINDVETICKEVKKISRNYNLTAELQIMVNKLEMEKNKLTSIAERNSTDQVIKSITAIIDRLSQVKPTKVKKSKIKYVFCDEHLAAKKIVATFDRTKYNHRMDLFLAGKTKNYNKKNSWCCNASNINYKLCSFIVVIAFLVYFANRFSFDFHIKI